MLVFYLPIIIFEAMLESQESKRKRARARSDVSPMLGVRTKGPFSDLFRFHEEHAVDEHDDAWRYPLDNI